MKKMDKKIALIIAAIVTVILIVVIVMIIISHKDSNKIKEYDNYLATISIATVKKQSENHFLARLYCDKENCKLSTNDKGEFFYQNNELIHVEDSQNLAVYNTKYFYKNIYSIISRQEKLKHVKEETNEIEIDSKDMNEILKNLYLDLSIKSDAKVIVNMKDNLIESISFKFDKVGLYDNIAIDISYQKLSDDFIVDTSLIKSDAAAESYIDHDPRFDEYSKVKRKNIEKNILIID